MKMKECVTHSKADEEIAHFNADELLVELLDSLGYQEVTSVYNQVDKWYA